MAPHTTTPPADAAERRRLQRVYAAARYCLWLPEPPDGDAETPFELRIGEACAGLARHLNALGHTRITLITAHNPFSRPCDAADNARRQQQLRDVIARAGRPAWPATSHDPNGEWPEEPGFCVPDLPPAIRDRWLEAFAQNAVVEFRPPDVAELVWHPRLRPRAET